MKYKDGIKNKWWFAWLLLSMAGLSAVKAQDGNTDIGIIPQPVSVTRTAGVFVFNQHTLIQADPADGKAVHFLTDYLSTVWKYRNKVIAPSAKALNKSGTTVLITSKGAEALPAEGYTITITPSRVTITGKEAGLFYGIQTLIQLFPVSPATTATLPCVAIRDQPRFGYRGMMLDVARHFYPVGFIKKYIDYLAMHKINTFHWHLTDDHGWRIEIKKYPNLTRIGAWRKGTQTTMNPLLIDSTAYGGYYTQDQIREIVAYAGKRFVTIIPEIEMPGHSLEVLAAYPALSCTGGPFEMPVGWGQTKDILCAGNENTFTFLKAVLTEITSLFPGRDIHIGGDEAPKDRWKTCPKCQAIIRNKGLKNEHELQSYFVKRIADFLVTKNKRIIGWDEILEKGLTPDAIIMSYRDIRTGIEAVEQHHEVIMTTSSYLYFDYYQGEPATEPASIGNFLPLGKVYAYEPVPANLSTEQAKYIRGVQANLWTEFVPTTKSVEYMTFPRIAALAEVAWSQPSHKNREDFMHRMEFQYKRYEALGINYAKSTAYVSQEISVDPLTGTAQVSFSTDRYKPRIYYTTDGSVPAANAASYNSPLLLDRSATIKAIAFDENGPIGNVSEKKFVMHAASGKKVFLDTINQPAAGVLTNGIQANADYRDKEWCRSNERVFKSIVDLGVKTPVKNIATMFLQDTDQFVFFPEYVAYAVSDDGLTFTPVALINNTMTAAKKGPLIQEFSSSLPGVAARYIKVEAKNPGLSPVTHYAPGQKLWLYTDEIVVNSINH